MQKGDFVTIRQNDLRDPTSKILSEVCNDTKIEMKLVPLSGGDLSNRTANRSNEARRDVWLFEFLGKRAQSTFWFKGIRPQHLPISQQIAATMSCYKRKWEKKGHTMKEYYK